MSQPISDAPVALLLGLDSSERVWTITLPPPYELLVPRMAPLRVTRDEGDTTHLRDDHRRFRLRADLASRDHRWWHTAVNGRSRTPEDGFVYLEVR